MKAGIYHKVVINSEGKIIGVGNDVDLRGKVSYFDLTGTIISITTVSDGTDNFVHVNPATTLAAESGFDNGGSDDGHLRYVGSEIKYFHIDATLSITPITSNDTFVFAIAVNDIASSPSKIIFKSRTNTDVDCISVHDTVELQNGDTLCVMVSNTTGTDDITVNSLLLMANG